MEGIIDEVPELDAIPTIHCVIMQKRETIHSLTIFVVVDFSYEKRDLNKAEIKEAFERKGSRLLGLFSDQERATEFLRFSIEQCIRSYTTVVNKLPNLEPVQERKFLAYIGEDVTVSPGIHEVNRSDYERLREHFASVRLATDEEALTTPQFYSSLIANDYERMKSLQLTSLKTLRLIADHEFDPIQSSEICSTFDRAHRIWDRLNVNSIRLLKGDQTMKREDVISDAMRLFPTRERAEQMIDKIIENYRKIISHESVRGPALKMKVAKGEIDYC